MDVRLTGPPDAMPLPRARAETGAIYRGLLVGASGPDGIVTPVSATWPDRTGRFELVFPASVRGDRLRFWQVDLQAFAAPAARPGGAFDVEQWPTELPSSAPRDVATLQIPPP